MKKGKLEPKDSDTLQSIYNKLTVNGELKEPLTAEEQVLLFSISKWIKKNVEEKEGMNLLQKIYGEIEQKAFTADEIYTDQWDGQKVYGLVCLGDIFDIFQNHTKDFSKDTYYGSGDEKSILCTVDKDGVLAPYDDTYDVIIHCSSKEDQDQTIELIKRFNWIPVSEYLPEVPEGTDDDCPEFNVTIKGADKATTLKYSPDGTWFDELGEVYQVVAWQSLPEPYKPEPEQQPEPNWRQRMMDHFQKIE